jgi:hypothetical protein
MLALVRVYAVMWNLARVPQSGSPQFSILLGGQPQVVPAPPGLNGVFQHLPARLAHFLVAVFSTGPSMQCMVTPVLLETPPNLFSQFVEM